MFPPRVILAALVLPPVIAAPPLGAAEPMIVLQRSPVAGFRHYNGPEVRHDLRPGDRLHLVREPDNPHDANAIRIEWHGVKLGYVPRRDNAAVARHLDRGTALDARIAALRENRNRSVHLEFEVAAPLE